MQHVVVEVTGDLKVGLVVKVVVDLEAHGKGSERC